MRHFAPFPLYLLVCLLFAGMPLYGQDPTMQLSIQIYDALGQAVTDASLTWVQADKATRPAPFDPREGAYMLVYNQLIGGKLVAKHPDFTIDGFVILPGAPQGGLCLLSAGTAQDEFAMYKGQRKFFRTLPECIGVQLQPSTWQNAAATSRLMALELELGLEKMDFPQSQMPRDPFERSSSHKLAYRYNPQQTSFLQLITILRESDLLTGVGILRADGSIVMPAFSVETEEAGLKWLRQQGFDPQPVAWQQGTYVAALTPSQELEFSALSNKMAKTKLFYSYWQNAYP